MKRIDCQIYRNDPMRSKDGAVSVGEGTADALTLVFGNESRTAILVTEQRVALAAALLAGVDELAPSPAALALITEYARLAGDEDA